MPLGDERVVGRQRRDVVAVGPEQLDDLPNVEAAPDHPGATWTPAESDPWVQPSLGGLFRQFLDHNAARPARPTNLIFDKQVGLLTETNRERLGLRGYRYIVVNVVLDSVRTCETRPTSIRSSRSPTAPAGRRPRLVGTGLDVWEVMSVVRDNDGNEQAAAAYLQLPADLVTAAVAYCDAHTDGIDAWIELNARESDAAHAPWLAARLR